MTLTTAANRNRIIIFLAFLFVAHSRAYSSAPKQEFYFIKIYQLKTRDQEEKVDKYLQTAFLPALHRMGIPQVGVFKPVGNDTAAIRRVYVMIPFQSMKEFLQLNPQLDKDNQYLSDGKDYLDAAYNEPPYARIETVLLQAFPGMPRLSSPGEALKSAAKSDRVYELRSYEGPTERLYQNKVQMFNKGDEIGLFKRLGFNAVFYASVLSGGHMPNLMYMTTFENMASRDEHWKSFGSDPYWKKLVAAPEYQHNVSKADILFLHPAEYSDL